MPPSAPQNREGFVARLSRRLRKDGLSALLARGARRALRPLYERMDLIYVDLMLAGWEPRLLRRRHTIEIVEVTAATLPTHRAALDAQEARYFEEQLARGTRLFVAWREGRLAGVISANREFSDPRWRVTCRVEADETILFRVYVAEDFRRGATGGVLVETVLQRLKDEGLRRITGVIHEENRPSLVLAENLGLQQYQRLRFHRFFGRWQTAGREVEGRKAALSGRDLG